MTHEPQVIDLFVVVVDNVIQRIEHDLVVVIEIALAVVGKVEIDTKFDRTCNRLSRYAARACQP